MSQSATLYQVPNTIFAQLKNSYSLDEGIDLLPFFKNHVTFQGSFMALEYVLSKGQNVATTMLVKEIFNPTKILGAEDFEHLKDEEKGNLYENMLPYLDAGTISEIAALLNSVSESDIRLSYDPEELNNNDIYPGLWQNDVAPDIGFNRKDFLNDFLELKNVFLQANTERNVIIVLVG